MKRNSTVLILVLCLSAGLMACNNNTPKVVAEKFLNSIYVHTDAEEAKKYCDSNTRELINQATHLNPIPDSVKENARSTKINIVDVKENGNTAAVVYTSSKHPDDKQILSLMKIDEKWLVQLNKAEQYEEEPMMPGAMEAIQDSTLNNTADTANAPK